MKLYKAIVVDDQQIISESMKELLKKTKKFASVTNFFSIENTKNEMLANEYDFLFTDVIMPDQDVNEFIRYCRNKWQSLIIIAVTSMTDVIVAREIFKAGVNAYISKYVGSHELALAIDKTLEGEKYVSSDLAVKFATSSMLKKKNVLTKREMEILISIAKGYKISEAATMLNISEHTVITHRRNIMEKLDIHSATELVSYAYENNLIDI